MGLLRKIGSVGRVTEPAGEAGARLPQAAGFGRSVQVRHVDAGYEEAVTCAKEKGVRVPHREG